MVRSLSLAAVQAARGAHGTAIAARQAMESARAGMDRAARAIKGLKEAEARARAASDGLHAIRQRAEDVSRTLEGLDRQAVQARVLAINIAIEAARAGARGGVQTAGLSGADDLAKRTGEAAGQARSLVESWSQSGAWPEDAIGTCLRSLEEAERLIEEAAQWLDKAAEATASIEAHAQQVDEAAQTAYGCVERLLDLASALAEGPSRGQKADTLADLPP